MGQIDRFHLIGHIILKWSHQFLKNVADNAFSVQNVALRGQWMVAVMYSHWKSSINHFILSVFLSHSSSRPRWELRTKSLKTDLQYFISNKTTTFEVTKISICFLAKISLWIKLKTNTMGNSWWWLIKMCKRNVEWSSCEQVIGWVVFFSPWRNFSDFLQLFVLNFTHFADIWSVVGWWWDWEISE